MNVLANRAGSKSSPSETVEILVELLAHTIHMRDLYKSARVQTADIQFHRLRQLFENHYREQIQLVDVLIDRNRAGNGAARVFAGDFLHRIHFSSSRRDRASVTALLAGLLDGHESVLNTANSDCSWARDFAVGRVVFTNDQQVLAVREQSMLL